MLKKKLRKNKYFKIDIEWIKANAVDFQLKKRYDSAVCFCEGAFGLLNIS